MTTPIWRPERRNRKIGTSDAGFRKSKDMRIPESWLDRDGEVRIYHNRIDPDLIKEFNFPESKLTVLYETPRRNFTYGCSPLDVFHLISKMPIKDLEGLRLVAFRQPTRKQSMMNPVWGRLIYEDDFGRHHGSAIILEAVEKTRPIKWSRKADLASQAELERLRDDGHVIESNRREYIIHPSEAAIRNTILYRTVLHEIGHWVHWLTDVIRQETALSSVEVQARDLYHAKAVIERESFAHRYAHERATELRKKQIIPFEPKHIPMSD